MSEHIKEYSILRITTVPVSLKLLLTDQMKRMKSEGYRVYMLSSDGPERNELIQTQGCEHIVIQLTRTISPFKDLVCLLELIKILRSLRPLIVHTHTPKAGLIGMIAARICGVPIRLHTIAGLPQMTSSGLKRRLLNFSLRLTAWGSQVMLPNSNSIMRYIKTEKLFEPGKLEMIGFGSSNGISLSEYNPKTLSTERLEKAKFMVEYDSSCYYLLACGRMVKDKGVVEMISAFRLIQEKLPKVRLILLGPFEMIRDNERLPVDIVNIINNNPNIVHINWSEDVASFMSLADLFVHASHREGFPNVLLQAGLINCPIICSDIPGNIDIVTDEVTGLYFRMGDTDDLSKKLMWAMDNTDIINSYSKRLQNEIINKYSRKFVQDKIVEFYNEKLSEL